MSGQVGGASLGSGTKVDFGMLTGVKGKRSISLRDLRGVYEALGYSVKSVVRFSSRGVSVVWR